MGTSASKEKASTLLLGKSSTSASDKEVPALPYPRASLLGLPPELRYMIYDIVKDFDISHQLNNVWGQWQATYPLPRLPLRDLARSCKLLAQDIRDHRHCLPANERYATIYTRLCSGGSYDAWLSRASCPARELEVLNLVCNIPVSSGHSRAHSESVLYMINMHPLVFPVFHRLRCPVAVCVHVFCQVWVDRSDPPSEEEYNRAVEDISKVIDDLD